MAADQGSGATERAKIWDMPTRIFHWTLAVAVCTGWYLGKFGPFLKTWHIYCGYTIATLIVFRVIWGVFGSHPSRFLSFIYGPRAFIAYTRRLFRREPSHWPGHNPMGGWAVIAMLSLLAAQVSTGLFADDDIANAGPLAAYAGPHLRGTLTGLHILLSKFVLAIVAVHVGIILFYWLWKRENLVLPMITGWKRVKRPFIDTSP